MQLKESRFAVENPLCWPPLRWDGAHLVCLNKRHKKQKSIRILILSRTMLAGSMLSNKVGDRQVANVLRQVPD
jgi:hypothetical protein